MAMMELNLNPTQRELRQFAIICLIGLAVVGAMLRWRFDLPTVALVLWMIAPFVGALGLAVPLAVKPLYTALMVVTWPIGYVLSHVVLGVTFYIVITGMGIVFRLTRRDMMRRTFDWSADTYWITRRPTTDMRRYFRQF